ncbi:MAG: LUD domain-containing protein [Anaerolineales bacterium]|nr:LUD domain-containing protein [Anaerolineales bacterium]
MNPFHAQIKKSLANPVLQAALDANAEKRVQARQTAYASLPEPLEIMRQRAHAVRSETIQNLDQYLEQFIAKSEENGIIVHRAADATQARQIVLDIAQNLTQRRGERRDKIKRYHAIPREPASLLIAKSKTMVSEEIKLNAALEAAGIQAVETDLGEYIVQLRGEPPSHIITPAVHLRRQEVGETFHEKLGIPKTEDIPTLTDAARAALRQTFLDADIGLSGVNFGVAETGSLCIVTNEGNGRMVTTIPPVHIALMGMERLVPALDDLALMLALLPSSATGQKITVYTQLIHGPRGEDEVDGPQERHLIILDNGRSTLRRTPLNDALMCIRCGACLNACPIFRELGGHAYVGDSGQGTPYPGPIGSVVSPGLFGQVEFGHLAQASTLCGACKDACPVDIDLPEMLLRVRAGEAGSGAEGVQSKRGAGSEAGIGLPFSVRFGLGLFTWASTSMWRFRLAQKLAAVFSGILSPRAAYIHLPAFTGWGYSKGFPRPARHPFRERLKHQRRDAESAERIIRKNRTASTTPQQQKPISNIQYPISRFETELTALGGTFTRCTPETLAAEILTLLNARGFAEIMAWEQDHLPEGLLDSLREQGIRIEHTPHPKLQAGITGALAAVAETGTLAQTSGAGHPQSTSLLPNIHIAILRENTIYANLPQVLNLREVREAPSVALISGPSRTADIEMTLTIGVHGPGEVHVFCI